MVRSKVQNLHSKTKKCYIAKELDDFNATVISIQSHSNGENEFVEYGGYGNFCY